MSILYEAIKSTATKRGSFEAIKKHKEIITDIRNNEILSSLWLKYSKEYQYASEIKYEDIFVVLDEMTGKILKS